MLAFVRQLILQAQSYDWVTLFYQTMVLGEGLEPSYCKFQYDDLLTQTGFTDRRRYPSR